MYVQNRTISIGSVVTIKTSPYPEVLKPGVRMTIFHNIPLSKVNTFPKLASYYQATFKNTQVKILLTLCNDRWTPNQVDF